MGLILSSTIIAESKESIYDLSFNDIDGNKIELSTYKGKYILFVNVASKCGFTKQYLDLEKRYQQFNDDLVVIGLPCNQFGGQEPEKEKEIKAFCSKNFGVSFILSEKIEVKGSNMPVSYTHLRAHET